MPKPPALDLDRLRREVRAANKPARVGAAGTYAAVRAALPAIEALLAEGAEWQAIADALAAQGVTQGVGDKARPVSRSRLTAVVSELRAQARRKAEREAGRGKRSDIAVVRQDEKVGYAAASRSAGSDAPRGKAVGRAKLQLAAELDVKPADATASDRLSAPDEEALRRADLAGVQRFLRNDE